MEIWLIEDPERGEFTPIGEDGPIKNYWHLDDEESNRLLIGWGVSFAQTHEGWEEEGMSLAWDAGFVPRDVPWTLVALADALGIDYKHPGELRWY